jgi:fibronectin type 3 domain-containing protein
VAGHPFFYRVIAVDSSGNASAPSNAAWALPADHTPPAPPASVTATLRARRLVVRWTPSPDRDVRGYHVYRGESADALTRLTGLPVPGPELVDSGYGGAGLVPGHAYTVRVTAVDSADNESAPAVAQVRVPDDDPPGPPAGFRVRVGVGRTAELAWSASSALDVRSYVLTREAPGPVVEIARTGADGRAARDTGLVQGRTYVYRLVAVDSVGNSSTVVRDSVFFGDDLPPAAPQAVTARAVTGGVEVTWERVASRDLAGYLVYRADLPTGRFARITPTPVVGQSFTDPSGQVGHFYQVRAVDTARNESGPSPVAGVVK